MPLLILALAFAAPPGGTLELAAFTRDVLAVNPEAAVAEATLEQARGRARSAGAWPDPMVDLSIAPMSLAEMPGWRVDVQQDLPLWGTRRAARAMVEADARAAEAQLEMMRLELANMAAMTWADWYTVHRELALVADVTVTVAEVHAATLSGLASGRATDLDVLAVEVELGWLATSAQALATQRDVVAYQVNTLLHRDPGAEVPPPPGTLEAPVPAATGGVRPELAETRAMVEAAEAEARMASADRLPMLGVMAGWDTMQEMPEHRLMAGVSVALPLDQRSRAATEDAARAGVLAAEAEALRVGDAVALDVARAERRYRGQAEIVATIEHALLPAVHARLAAARSAVASGTLDVRLLLEAERAALDAGVRHEVALVTLALRARERELASGQLTPGGTP